jgi:hypothetical protein
MRPGLLADMPLSMRLRAGEVLPVAATALAGLMLGALVVSKPIAVVGIFGIAIGVLAIWLAFAKPEVAFFGLIMFTALIPTYAAPEVGRILLFPAAAAGWGIAVALAWRNFATEGRVFHPTPIDYAAATFVLLMLISISFSKRATTPEFMHSMFLWIGPYLGARLLLVKARHPARLVALAFAVVTAIVAPIAIVEYLGASNPFHALDFNSTEFAIWSSQANRFGQVRAEASFGHPIALSMFASTSVLLSFAMALKSSVVKERRLWYLSALIGILVQFLTVSRTGWLVLLAGVVLVVLVYGRSVMGGRLLRIVAGVGVAFVLASVLVPSALQVLPGFEKHEAQVTASGDYRQKLLTRALEPGVLHLWGNPVNEVTPFVEIGSATDNAYIILADTWGLLPTFALMAIAFAMLGVVFHRRREDHDTLLILPIIGFTSLMAIFFVDFITQQQCVIWLVLGSAAVASERLWETGKARERPPAAVQRAAALERM